MKLISRLLTLLILLFTYSLWAPNFCFAEEKSNPNQSFQNPFSQELTTESMEQILLSYSDLGEGFKEDLYVRYFMQGMAQSKTHSEQLKRAQWISSQLGKDGFSRSFFIFFKFYLNLIQGEKISAFSLGQQIFSSGFLNRLTPPDLEKFCYEFNRVGSESRFQIPHDIRFDLDNWGIPTRVDLEATAAEFLKLRYFRDQLQKPDNDLRNSFYKHLYRSFFHSSSIDIGLNSNEPSDPIDNNYSKNYRKRRRAKVQTSSSNRNPYISLALLSTKAAYRDALGNFQKFLSLKQEAYLWELDENEENHKKTLELINEVHPTSATHLKLAQYHRNHRNWTEMNFHNNQALNFSPGAQLVEAPIPEITKLSQPILSNTVLNEIKVSFEGKPQDLTQLLRRRSWLKKHPSFIQFMHGYLESKVNKEQLRARIDYALVLLSNLNETQRNYVVAKLVVFLQLAKLWGFDQSLIQDWREQVRVFVDDPSVLQLLK